MPEIFHSITLISERCKGCTNCIKRCPTEAIRVRKGKAKILSQRCIDCGECVRVCPYHAKQAICDSLDVINNFKYTVALPDPTLYGQFHNLDDIDIVLNGLLEIGFDDVFEVAAAAEIVSGATRKILNDGNQKLPIISTACPAVVRLIRVRFPGLLKNLLKIKAPMYIAAELARKIAIEKTGLKSEDIGIIFISPCAAKNTAVRNPLGVSTCEVDNVVAIKDIYPKLLHAMEKVNKGPLKEISTTGRIGISWAVSGGESGGALVDDYLAADGFENVIEVLESLEDGKITGVSFVELSACSSGCVGGVLTVENPYVARSRTKYLRKYLPVAPNHIDEVQFKDLGWNEEIQYDPVLALSNDFNEALKKMSEIDSIASGFPGLDCGACGAPSCRSLAEDIVRGEASKENCVFLLRKH